ncbi:MAG: flagellar basal body P-ring formation protein FlgA [Spirochaetales bacterium]|nr:flagellar basal body P-ring formation protein FlgA [Spirochaetales bacterium]
MIKNQKRILFFFIVIITVFQIEHVYADDTILYLKKYLNIKEGSITADKIARSVQGNLKVTKELSRITVEGNPDSIVIYPVKSIYRLIERGINGSLTLIGDKIVIIPNNLLIYTDKSILLDTAKEIWQRYGMEDGRLELGIKDVKYQTVKNIKKPYINVVEYSEKPLKCIVYLTHGNSRNNKEPVKIYTEIKRFIPVAYASKFIKSGELISMADIEYRYKELNKTTKYFLEKKYFTAKESIVNYLADKQIEKGEPILKNCVKLLKAVHRGESVNIYFISKGVSVAMKGYALSSGGIHDRVRVKSYESGNTFWGTVRGEGEVDVALP